MLQVNCELLPLFEGSTEPAIPQPSGGNFGAPFNRKDADLIIRSSDQVDFHVHKSNLVMASVGFEDRFPTPGPSSRDQGPKKPVIDLTEDSKTLHRLLTMLYPVEWSMPETLEDAHALLATCQKYQMDSTLMRIRSLLKDHKPPLYTVQSSFHAYGIARRYHPKLKEEALVAARLTLERPLDFHECGEDLRFVSGADLLKLWRYRAECIKVGMDCIGQLKDSDESSYPTEQENTNYHQSYYNQQCHNTPRTYTTGWCYDHFLNILSDKPSPELIIDRQVFETAVKNHDYCGISQASATRICESVRAEVEAKLKTAIDEVSTVFGSQ